MFTVVTWSRSFTRPPSWPSVRVRCSSSCRCKPGNGRWSSQDFLAQWVRLQATTPPCCRSESVCGGACMICNAAGQDSICMLSRAGGAAPLWARRAAAATWRMQGPAPPAQGVDHGWANSNGWATWLVGHLEWPGHLNECESCLWHSLVMVGTAAAQHHTNPALSLTWLCGASSGHVKAQQLAAYMPLGGSAAAVAWLAAAAEAA